MSSHPHYNLRSRLNIQTPSLRTTPSASPTIPKAGSSLGRKARSSEYALQLQRVIGTTTNSPSGLSCCSESKAYAYCAGAVAVLAQLTPNGVPTQRYYRARPTAPSIYPPTAHYDNSPANTPSKRRTSTFTPRRRQDEQSAASLARDWSDESASQTWTARERIKSVSCVALSQDGKWLAVGETGYSPRVLLFSTGPDASCDIPISVVTDHAYGLRCVAFSADLKYLATLGDYKDGFLFIWSLNSRTGQLSLHSANKCTANICEITWCGNSLVTVGTRCVRIWGISEIPKTPSPTKKPRYRPSESQPSSPGPIPLAGRNVLLGSMVDCTFTCVVATDSKSFVIGTDTGYVCLVDTSQQLLELKVLKKLDLAVSSIAYAAERNQLVIGTSRGTQWENLDELVKLPQQSATKSTRLKASRQSIRRSLGLLQDTAKSVVAVGTLAEQTITLDNDGCLEIEHSAPCEPLQPTPTFAAHKSVILGVQTLPKSANRGDFFTYSKNAEIKFWNVDGTLLGQEFLALDSPDSGDENCENELGRMRYLSARDSFVAVDRFGVLQLLRNRDWEVLNRIRAHSAEITCIDVLESISLVATGSRDRTLQLFQVTDEAFSLLQTCDEHVGSVTQVLFVQDGQKLLSCSTDRSLVIRERVLRESGVLDSVAYINTKVLSLKSSPVSMAMIAEDALAISTMDRCIVKVNVSEGILLDSAKTGDPESNDTVSLNSLICAPRIDGADDTQQMLVGFCSVDKSIRVYNEKTASLLVRESGHTEGVSDIALLGQAAVSTSEVGCTLVSTGLDGTIMIWNVVKTSAMSLTPGLPQDQATPVEAVEANISKPALLPPMRKVLSKIEIADLTRASGQSSPSSPRSLSPVRLKRKTSRLALTTSIEEVGQTSPKTHQTTAKLLQSPGSIGADTQRPPSPPARPKLKRHRSRPDLGKEASEAKGSPVRERSPSPLGLPVLPVTAKQRQPANNSRLRRAPSVPADLHSYSNTASPSRRLSTSAQGSTSEFGSLAMATDQCARMLRIYKKKLAFSKEKVDLNELEFQASGLLQTIRERKDRTQKEGGTKNTNDGPQVDQLAVLLEGASITDSPTTSAASNGHGLSVTV
jgi:WD40 repeat protein